MASAQEAGLQKGSLALALSAHTISYSRIGGPRARHGGAFFHENGALISAELFRVTEVTDSRVFGDMLAYGSEDAVDTLLKGNKTEINNRFKGLYVQGGDRLLNYQLNRAQIEVIWLNEGEEVYVAVQRAVREGKPIPILEYPTPVKLSRD